ncbi:MAG: nickel transporter permease [Thermodesulfobacteriota bacterium]|nr:nickel transporter permease [Thermodesulfobacteriota bacterium]
MFQNRLAFLGAFIIVTLIFMAIFAPYIAPFDPYEQNLKGGLTSPSKEHPLGQDRLGRDNLSRIIYGSRVSIFVAISVIGISLLLGTFIGCVAGYNRGWIDELLMRVVDILLAFPGILLAIAMTAVLGPSLKNIVLALCITGWVGYARIVRGQILTVKEREYVVAAKALGANPVRIIMHHILPNILSPLIVEATFGMAGVILAEASLSFLGLGTQPPTPSWGSMLNEGRQFLLVAPHMTTFPGLAIMIVVLGFNFLGDGLRDRLDVRKD